MSVGPSWALAFLTSVLLTAAVIPLLRKVALAVDFVDRPTEHKSHVRPTPYLGGVGLIAGVLAGMLLASQLGPHGLVVALGATVLGTVGLVDDHRTVSPAIRLALELGVAALAVSVGLRISATGVPLVDTVLTLVWIVGMTNALNLLDNMDGLAGGVAAAGATAIFVLALLGGQELTASVAAALVGACLGFLVYNRRPASIFMGDTGSLFLGFALAVLSIEVDPALSPPASFAVPLLLLSLPVLDTVTVALARLRRAKAVSIGGRDHLSHRLVALGLSGGPAVAVLVGVEAVLGALAVAAGRGLVPLWLALAGATAVLGALSLVTSRATVYVDPVVGWPRWMKPALAVGAAAILLLAGPAVFALVRAHGPARAGERLAQQGLVSVSEGRSAQAASEFRRAERLLRRARGHLESPLASLGLAVPGVSGNLDASRTLVATSEQLAGAGSRLLSVSDATHLRVRDGTVPVDELRRLAPVLTDAARLLRESRDRLDEVRPPYLVPAVQRPLDDLRGHLAGQAEAVDLAAEAARVLPAVFGGDGPRHYFVAFQNNAELRGSGGLIGNWAELTAEDGHLRLSRFDRLEALILTGSGRRVLHAPQEFIDRYRDFDVAGSWQQVNVSPDFPTTARVIADLYPQSGGRPVDGVIAVDPVGLAALLELTGPVPVPGWPEPLTAENVVDVSLRGAYERYPAQAERIEFLGELSRTVFEAFTRTELASPSAVVRSLGRATRTNHLFVHLNRPDEQGLVTRLGADGAVPPVQGDSLLVVNQNLSANKVDLYLHRRVRYSVTLDPSSDLASLTGSLEVTLDNRAPPEGLPQGVIGPYDGRFAPGENRTYVSLATPFARRSATIDGEELPLESHPELGRLSSSATVSIPSLQSRTIRMELEGRVQLDQGGWYRLDLGHQPLVVPDDVDVAISVPKGWRIAETQGLSRRGPRQAEARLRLDGERSLLVRVERAGWSAFWHRLTAG